jgi:hypothetical protein
VTRLPAVLLFALLVGLQTVPAAAETVAGYARAVHGLRLRLDRQASASQPDTRSVNAIRRDLRSLRFVSLAKGAVVATNWPTMAGAIDPHSLASVRAGAAELDALDAAVQAGGSGPSGRDVSAAVKSAYAVPAFHGHCTGMGCLTQWIHDRISNSVQRLLAWIVLNLPGSAGVPSAVGAISIIIVVAALIGLALLLRRGALRAVTVVRRPVRVEGAEPDPDDPERLALDAANSGDLRNAYRFLFLSTMLDLQEQGLLRLRPGWTNRDYLPALDASSQDVRDGMRAMVDLFDRAWYGHQSLDRGTFDEMVDISRRMRRASRRGAA